MLPRLFIVRNPSYWRGFVQRIKEHQKSRVGFFIVSNKKFILNWLHQSSILNCKPLSLFRRFKKNIILFYSIYIYSIYNVYYKYRIYIYTTNIVYIPASVLTFGEHNGSFWPILRLQPKIAFRYFRKRRDCGLTAVVQCWKKVFSKKKSR